MSETDKDFEGLSRRGFLLRAGAGLAAASIAAQATRARAEQTTVTLNRKSLPETEKVGWAIAGIGNFAQGPILKNIKNCALTRVTGLVTRDPDGKGKRVAAEYGVDEAAVVNLENMHKLADRKDIDVVYVITPNGLHRDYALAALKAGKHVFCEKPFANTSAECQEMIDAAKAAGKLLGLGYRVQFDPHNIHAINAIDRGDIGKVKYIAGEFGFNLNTDHPAGAWRANKALAGGGSLMDIGVYGVNAARFLTQEEPVAIRGHVYSTPGDPRFAEIEETAIFTFEFASGVQFQGISSYGISGGNRFRAVGDAGWLDLEPAIAYEGARMTLKTKGRPQELPGEESNMFVAMMDDFSDAVRNGGQARSTGEDGLLDVRYMEAIYESAKNGGCRIEL